MTQVKKFIKSDKVKSLDDIVIHHYKTFIIDRNGKSITIEYFRLKNMTLNSLANMISNNQLWYATAVLEEVKYVPKKKVAPKAKAEIGNCKVKLKDIYGTD